MWHEVFHILLHALLDSLVVLPFLLVMYVFIEIFEANANAKVRVNKALSSPLAPLFGSVAGLIPQCGFSVVATKLYSNKTIRLGTLLSVFIATSDEAIPVILATPNAAHKLVPLLLLKLGVALFVGFLVNFILQKRDKGLIPLTQTIEGSTTAEDSIASTDSEHNHHHDSTPQACAHEHVVGCHGHRIGKAKTKNGENKKQSRFDFERYVFHPLQHTLTVFIFIFIVNFIIGGLIEWLGEDRLYEALNSIEYLQPVLAGLVGLIPNCAGSVIIAQMYAIDSISLGAAFAGLAVNAGIAFAILFKENKPQKTNFFIVALMYVIGVGVGMVITVVLH